MVSIIKAGKTDSGFLSEIAKQTFIESHGNSAKPEDINAYIAEKYSEAVFEKELADKKNSYYFIYYSDRVAGYSNIILNFPYQGNEPANIAKLERIYLLQEFYSLKLGAELFQFNIDLAKQNDQKGMWLFVWKENQRAVNFYRKFGFVIVGSHDFKISETHSNPNYQMFLKL